MLVVHEVLDLVMNVVSERSIRVVHVLPVGCCRIFLCGDDRMSKFKV